MKHLVVLFLLFSGSVTSGPFQDLCNTTIEHFVQKDQSSGFSISLQSSQYIRRAEIQLYDLYEGKTIAKKEVNSGLISREVIFKDVKPSLYTIFIKYEGCDRMKSIGGREGIKIGD